MRTYRAPKDPVMRVSDRGDASAALDAAGAQTIHWTVPQGWEQLPSSAMRFATFRVHAGGPQVLLTVVPLGPEARPLLANVNRWEKELELPPSSEADLSKVVKRLDVAGEQTEVVDLLGPETSASGPRKRTLAAILPHAGETWFFKMSGPAEIVAVEASRFQAFLNSVHFDAAPAPQQGNVDANAVALNGAATSAQTPAAALKQWTTPPGWVREGNPTPPRVLSFKVGPASAPAQMAVTKFPADSVGSFLDNVNRWRGQVGLEPVQSPEAASPQKLDIAGVESVVVDFAGPGGSAGQRVLVAIYVHDHRDFWFFKLSGPADTVAAQRGAFVAFLQSLSFEGESQGDQR